MNIYARVRSMPQRLKLRLLRSEVREYLAYSLVVPTDSQAGREVEDNITVREVEILKVKDWLVTRFGPEALQPITRVELSSLKLIAALLMVGSVFGTVYLVVKFLSLLGVV